jgi:hypothetical protein
MPAVVTSIDRTNRIVTVDTGPAGPRRTPGGRCADWECCLSDCIRRAENREELFPFVLDAERDEVRRDYLNYLIDNPQVVQERRITVGAIANLAPTPDDYIRWETSYRAHAGSRPNGDLYGAVSGSLYGIVRSPDPTFLAGQRFDSAANIANQQNSVAEQLRSLRDDITRIYERNTSASRAALSQQNEVPPAMPMTVKEQNERDGKAKAQLFRKQKETLAKVSEALAPVAKKPKGKKKALNPETELINPPAAEAYEVGSGEGPTHREDFYRSVMDVRGVIPVTIRTGDLVNFHGVACTVLTDVSYFNLELLRNLGAFRLSRAGTPGSFQAWSHENFSRRFLQRHSGLPTLDQYRCYQEACAALGLTPFELPLPDGRSRDLFAD